MLGFKKRDSLVLYTISFVSLVCMAQLSLFSPSLPEIQKDFGVSNSLNHLLVSISTFFYAFSTLFVGCLETRIRYKTLLIAGLLIFCLGSFVCYLSEHYFHLLLGRIIQGIGCSGPSIAGTAIIVSYFDEVKQRAAFGVISGITNAGFLFVPALGIYFSQHMPWCDDFLILIFLSSFGIILSFFVIPNISEKKINQKISWYTIWCGYKEILTKKVFQYASVAILLAVGSRIFFVSAPIIFIKKSRNLALELGDCETLLSLLLLLLSFSSGWIFKHFGTRNCLRFSVVMAMIFSILMLVVIAKNETSLILVYMIAFVFCLSKIYPGYTFKVLTFNEVPGAVGRIKAIISFSRSILVSVIFMLLGFFDNDSFFGVAFVMLFLLVISFSIIIISMRQPNFYSVWKGN